MSNFEHLASQAPVEPRFSGRPGNGGVPCPCRNHGTGFLSVLREPAHRPAGSEGLRPAEALAGAWIGFDSRGNEMTRFFKCFVFRDGLLLALLVGLFCPLSASAAPDEVLLRLQEDSLPSEMTLNHARSSGFPPGPEPRSQSISRKWTGRMCSFRQARESGHWRRLLGAGAGGHQPRGRRKRSRFASGSTTRGGWGEKLEHRPHDGSGGGDRDLRVSVPDSRNGRAFRGMRGVPVLGPLPRGSTLDPSR